MTIILEEGYQTNLGALLIPLRKQIESLNWLVTNLQCWTLGDWSPLIDAWQTQSDSSESGYTVVSGKELYDTFAGQAIQVVWGVFCGVAGVVPTLTHEKVPYADGNRRIWSEPEMFQLAGSEIEIIAFDSSFTLLNFRDEALGRQFLAAFPDGRIIQSPDDMLKSYQ
ncbi:hypothetical protein JAO73_13455 [Hymenobacter sp. BT523]|uniref:hypothetical protein n=1 Tax=Hymenobacter sp. BT523 TaxID=2795725 RepID=UPI0018ED9472|nr:hypothetical protein [Hymenobacter sp. BT523]MBJ6110023.1 hypothetical protein [Hymenobacter sp. BT523]